MQHVPKMEQTKRGMDVYLSAYAVIQIEQLKRKEVLVLNRPAIWVKEKN